MDTTVQLLISKLQNNFDGMPWYGDALLPRLKEVNYLKVNISIAYANSIARLLKHLVNWRIFIIKKLEGDTDYDIVLNDCNDWTEIHIHSELEWNALIAELETSQNKIIELLQTKNDAFMQTIVPNRTYTFQHMIEGIIQHDIYHFGQITFLDKLIK